MVRKGTKHSWCLHWPLIFFNEWWEITGKWPFCRAPHCNKNLVVAALLWHRPPEVEYKREGHVILFQPFAVHLFLPLYPTWWRFTFSPNSILRLFLKVLVIMVDGLERVRATSLFALYAGYFLSGYHCEEVIVGLIWRTFASGLACVYFDWPDTARSEEWDQARASHKLLCCCQFRNNLKQKI